MHIETDLIDRDNLYKANKGFYDKLYKERYDNLILRNELDIPQEDIASEGIVYILQQSTIAREAIYRYIFNNIGLQFDNIKFISQSIGKNNERPDISGINEKGKEVLIIEAKFWASLTENQPIEYLKRLQESSILLFICPKLRINSLNNEIEKKLHENNIVYSLNDKIFNIEENKNIFISDWYTILDLIKSNLLKNNENILVSDIDQLIGFCEIIDNYSFLPIIDKDLSPSIPKRINSYCDLLDKIVDNLKIKINANTDGLKASPQKYGYTRYLNVGAFGISIEVNFKLWEIIADTPFWVTIRSYNKGPWKQTEELKNMIKNIPLNINIKLFQHNNELSYALFPILNQVEEKVSEDIENKIISILKELG